MNLLEFQRGFNKWFELWEHEFNSNLPLYKDTLGQECLHNMVDILNLRDSMKGGGLKYSACIVMWTCLVCNA